MKSSEAMSHCSLDGSHANPESENDSQPLSRLGQQNNQCMTLFTSPAFLSIMQLSYGSAKAQVTPAKRIISTPARKNHGRGRVNHVTIEDAQESPNIVLSMLLIKDVKAVVLLDDKASHSFISVDFVAKHNLLQLPMRTEMIVSFPGEMKAKRICPKLNLKINSEEFSTDLIVLELKRIDVILGQNWISEHKGVMYYARKTIKLITKAGKELELASEVSQINDTRSKEDAPGREVQIS